MKKNNSSNKKQKSGYNNNCNVAGSQRSVTACLLGGTILEVSPLKYSKLKAKKLKENPKENEQYWIANMDALTCRMHELGINVWASVPTAFKCLKDSSVLLIKNFFQQDAAYYVLYWGGHGSDYSGDWCFSGEKYLAFPELIELWKQSSGFANNRLLVIISDCCDSGHWCDALQAPKNQNLLHNCRIVLQAACKAGEEAFVDMEGPRPGSLLMRKLLADWAVTQASGSKSREPNLESNFVWASSKQSPVFATTLDANNGQIYVARNTVGEKYMFAMELPCLRFACIERSWKRLDWQDKHNVFGYVTDSKVMVKKKVADPSLFCELN